MKSFTDTSSFLVAKGKDFSTVFTHVANIMNALKVMSYNFRRPLRICVCGST